MSLNRAHLRRALRTTFLGQGAVRWLSPRLRRQWGVALFLWGAVGGAVVGVMGFDAAGWPLALLVGIMLLVPFLAYDVLLSYLLLERRDHEGEMAVAARIQAGLLPDTVPEHDLWECAGRYRPARAVGGDIWEVLVLPDERWLLTVADVSGKGVPAAILMSGLRARLHLLAEQDPDPGRLAARLNEALAAETQPTEFATLLMVLLDPATRTLTYTNAGHPHGLLWHGPGEATPLAGGGMPVGMLPGMDYESRTQEWRPGDGLLLYSDGVLEAAVDRHGPLEPDDLVAALDDAAPATAATMVEAILARVDALAGGEAADDDVTVVGCVFRGNG